jgi:hypothetical protein
MSSVAKYSPADVADAEGVATHLVKSGYFADARDVSKAVTKILFGRSIGLDPLSSMTGINLVQGKPQLSAGTMARLIKDSGKYRYTIDELTASSCTVTLFEKVETGLLADGRPTWEWFKHAPFTRKIEEYKHLFSNNVWKQYPRNMLFARTISDLAKMLCPEVFGGAAYLPDEIPSSNSFTVVTPDGVENASDIRLARELPASLPARVATRVMPSNDDDEETPNTSAVVATDDDVKACQSALALAGLDLAWARRALNIARLSWKNITPEQVEALRDALDTHASLVTDS